MSVIDIVRAMVVRVKVRVTNVRSRMATFRCTLEGSTIFAKAIFQHLSGRFFLINAHFLDIVGFEAAFLALLKLLQS